jgi:hypothetical protein
METAAVTSAEHRTPSGGARLVLTIIGSAVLAGLGILGTFYWLLTFRWIFFASLAPLILGAYLFFTRATGPDHA